MKKILMKFSDGLLSKEQMKSVKGGYNTPGESGTCSVEVTCGDGSKISCSGSGGNCHKSGQFETQKWVQCDKDAKINC